MIRLPEAAIEVIRNHGRESYRDEACGALYGRVHGDARDVVRAAPLGNARDNERHRRFVVTAEDYRKAEDEAARSGLTLLGFYHSHPDHPSRPSQFDTDHAWPGWSYMIASVAQGKVAGVQSWELNESEHRFDEERMEIE